MLRNISIVFSALIMLLMTTICSAKIINLYEQPKSDAKVIGTIDPSNGIIPIFTPKEGGWVKVGNPNNGNVGWVKLTDLGEAGKTSNGFSFSQKVENTGSGPGTYVIKLGIPQLTKEQTAALYKQIEAQQAIMQQSIQKVIKDVFTNYNQMAPTEIEFPIVMPVIITPPSKPVTTSPAITPSTTPVKTK